LIRVPELKFEFEGRNKKIIVRDRKSHFIHPFWKEGQKPIGVLCCQFYEAKWSNGCLYACDYCYLKGTFKWQRWKGRQQTVFGNTDELLDEVYEFLELKEPMVLHTGEVADSLAVPGSEKLMAELIRIFGQQDKHTLLILTKSDNVDELLDVEHNGRTVIGFSINPPAIARRFEKGAATTEKRLRAAQKCIKAGYKVMVRVDPMIPVSGWRRQYKALFKKLNKMKLYGVVVGTLRAFPTLRRLLSKDLRSLLPVREDDRRYHLESELRWEMYRFAFKNLKFKRMGTCKESGETWAKLVTEFGPKRFLCNCRLQEV
jgi:spore photoproduct lyase